MKKVGRPTKYDPKYCQMLIEHMAKGLSYETFGASIKVAQSTVERWEQHEEFSGAKKEAFDRCRLFWENVGINGLWNHKDGPSLNTGNYVFQMKNRFKWTDRLDTNTNHSGKIDIPAINFIIEPPASDSEET
jgi:hypothetical protein